MAPMAGGREVANGRSSKLMAATAPALSLLRPYGLALPSALDANISCLLSYAKLM